MNEDTRYRIAQEVEGAARLFVQLIQQQIVVATGLAELANMLRVPDKPDDKALH